MRKPDSTKKTSTPTKPPPTTPTPGVERDHEDHGHRPQALDVAAEAVTTLPPRPRRRDVGAGQGLEGIWRQFVAPPRMW